VLKNILATNQMLVGLYRNVVPSDGGTSFSDFTEYTKTGTYITETLDNVVNESALAAGQYYVSTNSSGKASGAWCETSSAAKYLEWTFNTTDAALLYTVYGAFAWSYVLPFDSGGAVTLPEYGEIKVGDVVKGATSGAYAEVTAVWLTSGTWLAGTAAGWLAIKGKTGTFQNNEAMILRNSFPRSGGLVLSAAGTGYSAGELVEVSAKGGVGALVSVLSAAGGTVDTIAYAGGGHSYSASGTNLGTRTRTGAGTGLTVNVDSWCAVDRATTDTGTSFAGDAHAIVMWYEIFSESQLIDTNGQKIRLTVDLTMSTS
jgi:hypothetical protein